MYITNHLLAELAAGLPRPGQRQLAAAARFALLQPLQRVRRRDGPFGCAGTQKDGKHGTAHQHPATATRVWRRCHQGPSRVTLYPHRSQLRSRQTAPHSGLRQTTFRISSSNRRITGRRALTSDLSSWKTYTHALFPSLRGRATKVGVGAPRGPGRYGLRDGWRLGALAR